jgi:putative endonuclease
MTPSLSLRLGHRPARFARPPRLRGWRTGLSENKNYRTMYYTYVLLSERDNNLYTEFTKDLKIRLEKHNVGLVASTLGRRPLRLLYYEACLDENDAIERKSI